MKCPDCGSTMVYQKSLSREGLWTKDIYQCSNCRKYFIDDILEGELILLKWT